MLLLEMLLLELLLQHLLLGVGAERGGAAGDVDILAVVGHVLQGELRAVAGAPAHCARGQSVGGFTHLCERDRKREKERQREKERERESESVMDKEGMNNIERE